MLKLKLLAFIFLICNSNLTYSSEEDLRISQRYLQLFYQQQQRQANLDPQISRLISMIHAQPYNPAAIQQYIAENSHTPELFDIPLDRGQTLLHNLLYRRDIPSFEWCIHQGAQCTGVATSHRYRREDNASVLHLVCLKDETSFQNFLETFRAIVDRSSWAANMPRSDGRTPAIIMFNNFLISDQTTLQATQILQHYNPDVVPTLYEFTLRSENHKPATLAYLRSVVDQQATCAAPTSHQEEHGHASNNDDDDFQTQRRDQTNYYQPDNQRYYTGFSLHASTNHFNNHRSQQQQTTTHLEMPPSRSMTALQDQQLQRNRIRDAFTNPSGKK